MSRQSKLTDKDMSVIREGASTKDTLDAKRGTLKDYSLQHRVTLEWDLNAEAIRDHIFKFTIDDKTVLIDSEELMRYLRWV